MIEFEWNPSKAPSNKRKHGVTFEEAQSVFYDDFAIQFFDDENSGEEDRFLILGHSNQSRILLICHCEKDSGNLIRIISARKATAKERKLYQGETS
ncbi:BrnT family toxin [sulfur-oxidizing endosymbiont of Gigantopelta aegis]|uniref:BrnT family toxin n=1 Tax=sulfur-oxidizing endosymbiont of Gigantopelta aegis TaxID=2794934 RepID=UPI0018DB9A8E|nr:BrnT family toxin [sulfur-oxidizing endosymbiont of Gigantopelta aegis]